MSLIDKLGVLVIEDLKKVNINIIDDYARQNEQIITFSYNQGVISNTSIDSALEEAVFTKARYDYDLMTRTERDYVLYADHLIKPECLIYAMQKGKFSQKEIEKIPFGHGDNSETFQKQYGNNDLLYTLREKVLNPEPIIKSNNNDNNNNNCCPSGCNGYPC